MISLVKGQKPNVDLYLEELKKYGKIHYSKEELRKYVDHYELLTSSYRQYLSRYLNISTNNHIRALKRDYILMYFKEVLGVPQGLLRDNKKKTDSISADILEPLIGKGYDDFFIEKFIEHGSIKSRAGTLSKYLNEGQDNGFKSLDGDTLIDRGYSVDLEPSLRTYYRNHNPQSFPKNCLSSMKAPKGYVMVRGDFEQSDLKLVINMLLLDKSNIDIFLRYKDSYEALARLVEGHSFSLDRFKEERDDYKAYALGAVYGKSDGRTARQKDIVKKISTYAMSCPGYAEFKRRILDQVRNGYDVRLDTFFGSEILVNRTMKPKEHDMINYCLNFVPQRGTSEVVTHTVNVVMDKLRQVGVTSDNGGIYYYLNRHDEPIWLLKEEHLDKAYIFEECEDILVEGWIPLRIKFDACDCYSDEEGNRADEIFKSYYRGKEELDIEELKTKILKSNIKFIPTKNVFEITIVHKFDGYDKTVLVFNPTNNKFPYKKIVVGETDKSKLLNFVIMKTNELITEYKQEDSIIVVNTVLADVPMSYMAQTLVRITNAFSNIKYSEASNLMKEENK